MTIIDFLKLIYITPSYSWQWRYMNHRITCMNMIIVHPGLFK